MALLPLVLWALSGCSAVGDLYADLTGDGAAKPAPPPVVKGEAKGPDGADAVAKDLRKGQYTEALAGAEKALAGAPDVDTNWDLVELIAAQAHAEAGLLDRLAADQAIGGRVDRHQGLRARLALAANRPADALKAAAALQGTAPAESLTYTAWAVAAGAPAPADLSPAAAALVAALKDPAAPVPPEASSFAGGAAGVLLGELKAARGDSAGAAAAFDGVGAGPIALQIRAYRGRAVLPVDAGKALDAGTALAGVLAKAGDAQDASAVLAAAIDPAAGAGKLDALLATAGDLRKAAEDVKAAEAAAFAAAAQAEIALRAGMPKLANEGAALASQTAGTKERGQWVLAMSAAMLGDVDGVSAAATGLPGDEVRAVRDLVSAMSGEAVTLPSPGLRGDKAALEALLGAPYLADASAAYASAAAEAHGADLRLWARLAGSRAAGVAGPDAPAQLRAEDQVRGWLGRAPGGPLADSTHPKAAAWSVALGGQPVPAGAGAASIARFRQSLTSGDGAAASTALVEAAAILPAWRSGPLAPILALDGPVAEDAVGDAAAVAALTDAVPTAVALHGWAHRAESARRLWTHGASPLPGDLPAEKRIALYDAAAHLRAGQLAWANGLAPWPADAEKAFGAAASIQELPTSPLMSVSQLRDLITHAAILSVLPTAAGPQLLVVTDDKGKVALVSDRVVGEIATFRDGLQRGANNVAAGDRVRADLLDPVMDVLTGIGGYTIVGPGPVGDVPIPQLPEQSDGLRFLASIRHVTRVASFEALVPPPRATQEFPLTAFAICASAEECDLVKRHWNDAVVAIGADATVAKFKENAGKARYLVIGGFAAAPGGGFKLPGGEVLSLSTVASMPVYAQNVAILGAADEELSLARASAFRSAGSGEILATVWTPSADFRDTLLSSFFEGINKRKGSSRAFDEARNQAIKLSPEGSNDPGHWGGYLIYSAL